MRLDLNTLLNNSLAAKTVSIFVRSPVKQPILSDFVISNFDFNILYTSFHEILLNLFPSFTNGVSSL